MYYSSILVGFWQSLFCEVTLSAALEICVPTVFVIIHWIMFSIVAKLFRINFVGIAIEKSQIFVFFIIDLLTSNSFYAIRYKSKNVMTILSKLLSNVQRTFLCIFKARLPTFASASKERECIQLYTLMGEENLDNEIGCSTFFQNQKGVIYQVLDAFLSKANVKGKTIYHNLSRTK